MQECHDLLAAATIGTVVLVVRLGNTNSQQGRACSHGVAQADSLERIGGRSSEVQKHRKVGVGTEGACTGLHSLACMQVSACRCPGDKGGRL